MLGAGGLEHHVQESYKLKAALDLSSATRLSYVLGIWRDDSSGTVESYIRDAAGPVYTSAFASGLYSRDALHWSHALSLQGAGDALQWQLIGTLYDYGHDIQRSPNGAPPAAFTGGAGNVVRQDGTGWATLDAKGALSAGSHALSLGAHLDRKHAGEQSLCDRRLDRRRAGRAQSGLARQDADMGALGAGRLAPDAGYDADAGRAL